MECIELVSFPFNVRVYDDAMTPAVPLRDLHSILSMCAQTRGTRNHAEGNKSCLSRLHRQPPGAGEVHGRHADSK